MNRNGTEKIHWLDLFGGGFSSWSANRQVRHAADAAAAVPEVPVKGMVTMVDIGADSCIPCKMMAPIMKEWKRNIKEKQPSFSLMCGKTGTREQIRDSRHPTRSSMTKTARRFSVMRGSWTRRALSPSCKNLA